MMFGLTVFLLRKVIKPRSVSERPASTLRAPPPSVTSKIHFAPLKTVLILSFLKPLFLARQHYTKNR